MRAVKIHLTVDVMEDTEDKDIADLRDVLVELADRFPGMEVRSYGVTGWRHDGTAIEGMPPVAGNHDERINALLEKMAKRNKSGTPRTALQILTERFAGKINFFAKECGLFFRVDDLGGGFYGLHAEHEGRHYFLYPYGEDMTVATFPWDMKDGRWPGWSLQASSHDDYESGEYMEEGIMFPNYDWGDVFGRSGLTDDEAAGVLQMLVRL